MPLRNAGDTGCNITRRESGQTSGGSFLTREFEEPAQEAKQMMAERVPAGAVSRGRIQWHAIDWQAAHENVSTRKRVPGCKRVS
jgi:hypothetical protein